MILADTSIWIDHFRSRNQLLFSLLNEERILSHPMVIGEVAMSSLADRRTVLRDLSGLPAVAATSHREVIALVEWQKLHSLGLGFIDAHLLASVRITADAVLWTRDKRLAAAAERLNIAFTA